MLVHRPSTCQQKSWLGGIGKELWRDKFSLAALEKNLGATNLAWRRPRGSLVRRIQLGGVHEEPWRDEFSLAASTRNFGAMNLA